MTETRAMPDTERAAADQVFRHISRLVTLQPDLVGAEGALGVIRDGAIAAHQGRVTWVGRDAELAGAVDLAALPPDASDASDASIDLRGHAVLPGFVDSHTHFLFAGDRAEEFHLRHQGVSYEELGRQGRGILSTVRATRAADDAQLATLGREHLRAFAAVGTTTVEGKTGYGLDMASEDRCLRVMDALGHEAGLPRVVPTFLGAHTIPPEYRGSDTDRARYVDLVVEEMLPAFAGRARFCDVFCESGAFTVAEARRILLRAKELGYLLKVHANQLGPSGGARLAAEVGATSADHLDFASDEELALLREAGVVATLLPGCSFSLSTPYPSAHRLYEAGLTVALATDFNPGTSYCESLQMMLALAISAMGMTLDEALTATTLGGAHALGLADDIGSLVPGKRCDLAVLAGDDERALGYHFGVNLVAATYVGGRPVWRATP